MRARANYHCPWWPGTAIVASSSLRNERENKLQSWSLITCSHSTKRNTQPKLYEKLNEKLRKKLSEIAKISLSIKSLGRKGKKRQLITCFLECSNDKYLTIATFVFNILQYNSTLSQNQTSILSFNLLFHLHMRTYTTFAALSSLQVSVSTIWTFLIIKRGI